VQCSALPTRIAVPELRTTCSEPVHVLLRIYGTVEIIHVEILVQLRVPLSSVIHPRIIFFPRSRDSYDITQY
jgi:hypothetical protein